MMKAIDRSIERDRMVEHQIKSRGVRDQCVLDAMRAVPRERFVPENLQKFAYADRPLAIEADQTISQPYIVAVMIEALAIKGGERVLEVGTGSGYAAAVLGRIAAEVYTIERIKELADHAAATLKAMNCQNIHVLHGDGTLGWTEHAPFDAIMVSAGGPSIPPSLQSQLKIGGRLVIPVGGSQTHQELVRLKRTSETGFQCETIADVLFVPLIGDQGWKESNESDAIFFR